MAERKKRTEDQPEGTIPVQSVDETLAERGADRAWLSAQLEQLAVLYRSALVGAVFVSLNDVPRWTRLAKDQKAFDKELNKIVKAFRLLMHAHYGISKPHNRPVDPKNADRDQAIYHERQQHPEYSFEAIGANHNLSSRATRQAHERHVQRLKLEMEELSALAASMAKDFGV